jgi:hypothetical protein
MDRAETQIRNSTHMLNTLVNQLLTAQTITPMQVIKLLNWARINARYGRLKQEHMVQAVLQSFEDQGRSYLSPWQMALLCGRDDVTDADFDHLNV